MKIRTLVITLCISMILSADVQAAFPISSRTTLITDTPIVARGEILVSPGPTRRKKEIENSGLGSDGQPIYKKRSKANLLALLGAIPFLSVAMGLHRIYLGYYTQGLIRFASPYVLFILMGAAMAASTAAGIFVGILFTDIYIALLIWQIVDMAHIRSGKLLPKQGKYRDKKTDTNGAKKLEVGINE